MLGSVLGMLESGATHLGVATDHVVESFRNDLWIGYKTSEGMDPVLLAQFPLLEDALRALGVPVWAMVEYEADDALASAARVAREDPRVERAYICTPDKDLGQCVVDPVIAQLDRRQERVIDEAGVREKFGVGPASIPDYLALVGDSADGFPGLPGWGAKSAAIVLARYEHIDRIPDDAAEWDVQPRRGEARGHAGGQLVTRPNLFLDLATLRTDADVGSGRRLAVARAGARAGTVGSDSARLGSPPARPVSPKSGDEAEESGRRWRTLELTVGEYTFSALADGPDDGDLVLLLHGFPETSYEWKAQIPVLADAGYRVVAPDQRGYAAGARPSRVEDYGILELVGDALGFIDALGASTCHLVGHDWGGAVAWVVAVLHPDRLRTLTAVSTPHPTPFGQSIREGEQKEKSAYMDTFRAEGAEDLFLADDGAMMRRALASFGMHDTSPVDEYYRVLSQPGAMTGALNWYRANDIGAGWPGASGGDGTDDVRLVDRRPGAGPGGRRGDCRVGRRPVPVRGARGREPLGARGGPRRAQRLAPRPFRNQLNQLVLTASSQVRGNPHKCHTPRLPSKPSPSPGGCFRWRRWWWSWWWWRSSPAVSCSVGCWRGVPCREPLRWRSPCLPPCRSRRCSASSRCGRRRIGPRRPRPPRPRSRSSSAPTRRCWTPERRLGTQELDGKKSLIDQELHGMRGDLAKLTGLLHQVESERQKHTGELTTQLQEAGRHTQILAETTQSLREALSSTIRARPVG